jgi:transmembrane sensor
MAQPIPIAAGLPISDKVADEAAAWVTLFMSSQATSTDHLRLQAWRDAHPDHERAWQHIEAVSARMRTLDTAVSRTLSSVVVQPSAGRRATLALVCLGIAGAAGFAGTRTQTWQEVRAHYRTAKGERREWTLEDDTRLTLNTDSAVNVDYSGDVRRITLVAGEILVQSGHRATTGVPETRRLMVSTRYGDVEALGTRFSVRDEDGRASVVVFEHRVRVSPQADSASVIVAAGQRTVLTQETVSAPQVADPLADAWAKGQLIAVNMRLADFIEELGRYRTGVVRCDPAVADLRFSGVFPLDDPEKIVAMLPGSLPVQLRMRTRYWVTIEPAGVDG